MRRGQERAVGRKRHRGLIQYRLVTGQQDGAARLHVPQPHPVLSSVDEGSAIGGERHRPDRIRIQGGSQRSGRHVPQSDGAIHGPGSQGGPVGREGQGNDSFLMPPQPRDFCPCGRVPQPDGEIMRSTVSGEAADRSQEGAIRGKRHRVDLARMPHEGSHLRPGLHVPQPDRVVSETRDQPGAVRREGNGKVPRPPLHLPGTDPAPGLPVPERDDMVRCPGSQGRAIRRKDHRLDLAIPTIGMAERADPFPCFHLPQLDLTVRQSGNQDAVERKRHRVDNAITRQQRQGAGRGCLVQPHADGGGHGQVTAVGRMGHRPVPPRHTPLAQTRRRPLGEMPGPVVSSRADHPGADPLCAERRELEAADGDPDGVRAFSRAQGKGKPGSALGIGGGLLDREPAAELSVACGDREGDRRVGQGIPKLIPHFHDQGVGQRRPGRALLAVAGEDLQLERTAARPLGRVPQQD